MVSFSRHLCSRRDARGDKHMPNIRLLSKVTSKIQMYLHWRKQKIFIFSSAYWNWQKVELAKRIMVLIATSEYRVCILVSLLNHVNFSTEYFNKLNWIFYLKQINVITGPASSGGPGAISPVAPLNPALWTSMSDDHHKLSWVKMPSCLSSKCGNV